MTIRPTRRTAVVASLSAVLIAVATIAACAPTGGGGGGDTPTTTAGPTTTAAPTTTAGPTTSAGPTTTIAVTTTTIPAPTCSAPQSIVIQPNPVAPVGPLSNDPLASEVKSVQVCYNIASTLNKRLFVQQCFRAVTDPLFQLGNCQPYTTYNPLAVSTAVVSTPITYGHEPSGDENWGCYKSTDTAPPGVTKYTTCYLRITDDTFTNVADQVSVPFTFG